MKKITTLKARFNEKNMSGFDRANSRHYVFSQLVLKCYKNLWAFLQIVVISL